MIYDFNIPSIIRRYAPEWFRMPRNLQFVVVLATWLERLHTEFLVWREGTIIAEYRYNGLIHSLEWALNDRFDSGPRRIYITVIDQVPAYYHLTLGQAPYVPHATEGALTGYAHMDVDEVVTPYLYEFLVHVPAELSFNPTVMFDLLDLYRYAGRRPAIRRFGPSDDTVETIIYYDIEPAANEPIGDLILLTP